MDWFGRFFVFCFLLFVPGPVIGKLCCESDCKQPVSYGRTVQRHITRDEGFLSYPASAIVTVFAKQAYLAEEGEYWEAEIQGKRGLIHSVALKELTLKCEPTVTVQGAIEERSTVTPPPSSDSTHQATPMDHTHHATSVDTLGDNKPTEDLKIDHFGENQAERNQPGSHEDAVSHNGDPTVLPPTEQPAHGQRMEPQTVGSPSGDQGSSHPPVPESVGVLQVDSPHSMHGGDTRDHLSTVTGDGVGHDVETGDHGVKQETLTRPNSVSGGENFEPQQVSSFQRDVEYPSTSANIRPDPTPLAPPQDIRLKVVQDEQVHREPDTFLNPSQAQEAVTKVEYQPPQHTPTGLPPSYQTEPPSQDFESDPLTPTPDNEFTEEGGASQEQLQVEGNLKQDKHTTGNDNHEEEPPSALPRDDLSLDQTGQHPPDHSPGGDPGPPPDSQGHNRKIFSEDDDERYWDAVDEDEWTHSSEKREQHDLNVGGDQASTRETNDPLISPEAVPSVDKQHEEQTGDLDISKDTSEYITTLEPTVASSVYDQSQVSTDTPHPTPPSDEPLTHTGGVGRDEGVPTETTRDSVQAQEHAGKLEGRTFIDHEDEDEDDEDDDDEEYEEEDDEEDESERERSKSIEEMKRVYEEQQELSRQQLQQQQQILLQQKQQQQHEQRQQEQQRQQEEQQRQQEEQHKQQQEKQRQQEEQHKQEQQRQQEEQQRQKEEEQRQQQQQHEEERRQDKEDVSDTPLPGTQEEELYTHPPQTSQPPSLEPIVTPTAHEEPTHNEGGYEQFVQEIPSTPLEVLEEESTDPQDEYEQRQDNPDDEDNLTPPSPDQFEYQPHEETVTASDYDYPRDVAPPPSCGGYRPLPGSDTGVLWYVEQYRVYVRDMVFATFPEAWSEWIIENRPMLGVVSVTMAFVSLSLPLMLIMCLSCRSGQGSKKQVISEKAARVKLEGDRVKLEGERNALEHQLSEARENCQSLQDDVRLLREDMSQMNQANQQLEAHKQSITESLAASQQDLSNYQAHTEQLNTQITSLNEQLHGVTFERDSNVRQKEELGIVVRELEGKVEVLEAQKDQLEQDKYNIQNTLETLQAEHDTVTRDLEEFKDKCSDLDSRLVSMTTELETERVTLRENEDELQHLRQCLSQLTDQVAESATGGDEGINEGDKERKETQLSKIKAMLDTSKVQTELHQTMAERDSFHCQLQEKSSQLDQQIVDNNALQEQLSQLETKERSTSRELKELQIKMKGVTEYFQEKESDLHHRLELGEINQQKYKSLETEAQEKATASEQERERERNELKELRKQMADIEKSFLSQLRSNEERAEDALVQLRRTEQDYRQANREVTTLKRRLAEAEIAARHSHVMRPIPRPQGYPPPQQRSRPPSTGPIGPTTEGPSPQTARPLSAPRLEPRTSSPTNEGQISGAPPQRPTRAAGDGTMHKSLSAHSMHNNSLPPMRAPRSQADVPPRPHSRGANDSNTHPPGQADLPTRPHSRGAVDPAAYPRPPPAMRKGPMNRPMPREQIPPGPIPGQLPKLDEHPPPRQYGMAPPPATTPTRQLQQHERPRPSQAPPPTSGERVHTHPPPGDYPVHLTNSRPPPQDPHRENVPRRPYPPTRPPYGAPYPSRIQGQPPRGPPYRPPVPQSGPTRPNYPYPPRVQGEPPRPQRPQEGAPPQYAAGSGV